VIREKCRVKDVVTKIEMLNVKTVHHVEKMDERRLTNEICEADLDGNAIKNEYCSNWARKARSRVLETSEHV
jgi:hypothetical protein